MKIGAVASCFAPATKPADLLDLAQQMDRAGLDSLWFGEHALLFDDMEFGYPGSADGKLPIPHGQGAPDQTAVIGFLASQTSQLRFGTSISLIPQRNPVYTAKEFATLDWLSNGRIELGVGVGWCKEEVEACGYDWSDRGRRCDEALELMLQFWSQDVVSFSGNHFNVQEARMDPKPLQKSYSNGKTHIPLAVGGFSQAAFNRTAKYGQSWLGFGLTPAMTKSMLKGIDASLQEFGRTRKDLEIIMMPGDDSLEAAQEFADLGVDRLIPMIDTTGNYATRLEHLHELKELYG